MCVHAKFDAYVSTECCNSRTRILGNKSRMFDSFPFGLIGLLSSEMQLDIVCHLILLDCLPVKFRHGERIAFSYLISQKHTGDNALVKVLRKSEMLEFNIKLGTHKRLIPGHIKGRPPSYYIVAGFVFTAVSVPYLRSEVSNEFRDCLCFLSVFTPSLEYIQP